MSDTKQYRAGIIGCGGIASGHAVGYQEAGLALVAGADIVESQRRRFQARFPTMTMYKDYHEMLAKENLDFASVCTWPPLHEEMVVASAEAGVKGIVCEKPVAVNLAQVDHMIAACEQRGVKLIIGHQRRFNKRYNEGKEALKRGEIGDLVSIHGMCVGDLLSDGTHCIDMVRFLNDDQPIKWVLGQVNRHAWNRVGLGSFRFGHEVEAGSISRFDFANGVRGLIETGEVAPKVYQQFLLEGTKGVIEVYGDRYGEKRPSGWRILREGQPWEEHLIENEVNAFTVEIVELVRWIEQGGDHLLSARSARCDHEFLMAVYESCRDRCTIDLPLLVQENPLEAMISEGLI